MTPAQLEHWRNYQHLGMVRHAESSLRYIKETRMPMSATQPLITTLLRTLDELRRQIHAEELARVEAHRTENE